MSAETSAMRCPKCQGAMRSYERNGVTIDQCTECRGVFLDRGELERLIDAESAHYEDARREETDDRGRDTGRDRGRGHEEKPRKKKKRGFLSDMLEGFGE
jgi:Zn-finger nucleic acid-binding protein